MDAIMGTLAELRLQMDIGIDFEFRNNTLILTKFLMQHRLKIF